MTDPSHGLIETVRNIMGGAAMSLIAAFIGRGMFHAQEVRAKRRPIWSRDLFWEVPLAVGMAMIGEGLAEYMGLTPNVRTGLIAVLSYLGPRGAGALLEHWVNSRRD